MTAAHVDTLSAARAEKDAAGLIAEAALLKVPVYRLQAPGPMFLACIAGGTRGLADLAALQAFVDQIRGRRG